MQALTGELLLTAWSDGADKDALARSLVLLALALPESERQQIAWLPLAQRNLLLLQLREISFGPVLQGFGICPQCSAQLEFSFPIAQLTEHVKSQLREGPLAWTENGRQHQLRAVTTADLLAVADAPTGEEAQDQLMARCLSISGSDEQRLPDEVTTTAFEKFDELHAAAELSCAVHCAGCSGIQTLFLDIAQFLWLEVRSAARRLLAEVHALAWAYGWSESSLLAMSPQRRNAYIEMLNA